MAKETFVARESTPNPTNSIKTPRIALNSIRVDDSSWRFSMGRSRPSGRGNWAFSIGSREAFDDIEKAFFTYGSYSEAVKAAKKEAQKRGASAIYVMG